MLLTKIYPFRPITPWYATGQILDFILVSIKVFLQNQTYWGDETREVELSSFSGSLTHARLNPSPLLTIDHLLDASETICSDRSLDILKSWNALNPQQHENVMFMQKISFHFFCKSLKPGHCKQAIHSFASLFNYNIITHHLKVDLWHPQNFSRFWLFDFLLPAGGGCQFSAQVKTKTKHYTFHLMW